MNADLKRELWVLIICLVVVMGAILLLLLNSCAGTTITLNPDGTWSAGGKLPDQPAMNSGK